MLGHCKAGNRLRTSEYQRIESASNALVRDSVVLDGDARDGHVRTNGPLWSPIRIRMLKMTWVCAAVQTHYGDSVTPCAAVPLEHNVASLVDGNTVILVVNCATERHCL